MLRSTPQAVMLVVVPRAPPREPLQRNTIAELVMLPSHDKKPRAVSHGPIESERHGIGRRLLMAIFRASDRSSTQLLIRKQSGVSGHATEKRDKYPIYR